MGKNQSASNLTNIIKQDGSGNIVFTSGSTTLATISTSGQLSGSTAVKSATTASYADNFTVTGNLTAQTLIVQTITSSVDFVTGSTRFGSLSSNTHTFTGSVLISGSSTSFIINNGALFVSSSGNIGIGATNPTNRLEVIGVSGSSGIITPLYVNGWNATTNVGGTNTSYGGIHLSNAVDTTAVLRLLGSGHIQLATDATGRFISFATDNFVERMRIASGGSVGIGTNNPIFQCDVNAGSYRAFRVQANDDVVITFGSTVASSQYWSMVTTTNASGQGINNAFFIGRSTSNPSGLLTRDLLINSSGFVTEPSQPVAIGALVSDQSVSATTFTTLNFDTGTGYFARNIGSAWNNSTRTFTAPVTGTYEVVVSLFTNNVGQVAMFVNGGRTISIVSGVAISSNTTWCGNCLVYLTAGDALTLRGYGDGSGTLFANTFHTWFQIRLLG